MHPGAAIEYAARPDIKTWRDRNMLHHSVYYIFRGGV